MLVRNRTPFVPLVFAGMDVRDRVFGVLVLRGTFEIVPEHPLRPVPAQAPLFLEDVFHGEPARSSLRFESDLVPFKPRADIHVHAVARAPGGWPQPRWDVRVRVGVLEKQLTVCGERRWVREGGAYRLTEPEACAEVPIRYEHAYGGVWRDAWGEAHVAEENPVGVGFVGDGELPAEPAIPAPRIESPVDPIRDLGVRHRPEGLGPVFRAWLPRRGFAGTYDDAWQRDRWPCLPLDFSAAFYNSAHPDLVYPGYLRGGEGVELAGVHPAGPVRFSLPSLRVASIATLRDGADVAAPLKLDTLVVDLPEGLAYLTWRAVLPSPRSIREIDARMREEA